MNVLLIGSGGREHALAWKIAASPVLTKLYCAPGNPGIADVAECVALEPANHEAIITFCKENNVDFVVVGPEAPLVAGIADDLRAAGISVFGPSKAAARLEGSKGFTKDLCAQFDIPTGKYQRFTQAEAAKAYIRQEGVPIVVKADGLAAGKGVVVAFELQEALDAVDACFDGAFGGAGAEVVVEEYLEGEEASFFCLCDGKTALPFGTAQDHKRVGDGDTGDQRRFRPDNNKIDFVVLAEGNDRVMACGFESDALSDVCNTGIAGCTIELRQHRRGGYLPGQSMFAATRTYQ